MDGYKGYRLEHREGNKFLVSPLGVDIAVLYTSVWGDGLPKVETYVPGMRARDDCKTITEMVKDMAEQHLMIEGNDDDDRVLGREDARIVIKNTVTNYIQVNHNSLGVQITADQLQLQINEAVDKASPGTLREIVKTWIPQAVSTGAGIATLLKALGIGA